MADASTHDVVVLGGCGHVGLPLALAFADRGLRVGIYDTDEAAVRLVGSGQLPFQETGAAELLQRVLSAGRLDVTSKPGIISGADAIVVVVGTPVDEHLNPNPHAVAKALALTVENFRDGQLLVLRSTIYPGVTAGIERLLDSWGLRVDVAFCPERIAEGKALEELFTLPQIVSGRTADVKRRAAQLFGHLTDEIIEVEPEEAELAKLFTNSWRYIKFAAANQFFMMANDHGLDFEKIRAAVIQNYPRAADMPSAGFAAGPCLFKDTMQLAAFANNAFPLGHSSMLVNEGLPLYIVAKLEERFPLRDLTVGILGMAFKGDSDDIRSSLSYKLKRILEFRANSVLTTDPHVTTDQSLLPLGEVLERADLLIVGAPHAAYRELNVDKPVADVWNLLGGGVSI